MSSLQIRVDGLRLLPGRAAGLAERTALAELSYTADADLDAEAEDRIRSGVAGLVDEPLPGVAAADWPAAFLVDPVADPEPARRLGEWVIAVTVAVQRWGRDPVWSGRVVRAGGGRIALAIGWQREQFLRDALDLALRLLEQWVRPQPDAGALAELRAYLARGLGPVQQAGLLPNTLRFAGAAAARGIPVEVLPSFVQFGWGAAALRMDSSFTGSTSHIATMMARNKFKSSRTLADAGVPMPDGEVVADAERAVQVAARLGWPVVVKPLDSDQGAGVTVGVADEAALRRAFGAAAQLSPGNVIVERQAPGDDHRLLVVAGRLLAAARRTPAAVTGDGAATVAELVDRVNADPCRGTDPRSLLRSLEIDGEALDCLAGQGLSPGSVPAAGRLVPLRRTANISTGGTAVDVTGRVHPDNRELAERAARLVGLDIAGIDLLITDISRSWREAGGLICEVNAQPGFRPHWLADPGRDLNGEILDVLFAGRSPRIPTAAITGTNGKSTTAAMLHRIWTAAGRLTGVCTTAQLRIGEQVVSTDNLSGYPGARIILTDPGVESAVFEMPRKGLVIFGHPCDRYDVAALLNVSDDHLGEFGVDTVEQMAELKAEVLARAHRAIVVNADDPLCMAVRDRSGTDRHVLVSSGPANPAVVEHRRRGGEAVFGAEHDGADWIVLADGAAETPLMAVGDIPATMDGLLRFNRVNAMFAAALAWAQGVDLGAIRRGLGSFANSIADSPGRYNVIEGLECRVLLDYAHNPEGVREVCAVAAALPVAGRRLAAVLNVGNRHRSHLAAVAGDLAATFDEIVLGCDPVRIAKCPDYAGEDPVATMLEEGGALLRAQGAAVPVVEREPARAIRTALRRAGEGDLVVLLADSHDVFAVIGELGSGRPTG